MGGVRGLRRLVRAAERTRSSLVLALLCPPIGRRPPVKAAKNIKNGLRLFELGPAQVRDAVHHQALGDARGLRALVRVPLGVSGAAVVGWRGRVVVDPKASARARRRAPDLGREPVLGAREPAETILQPGQRVPQVRRVPLLCDLHHDRARLRRHYGHDARRNVRRRGHHDFVGGLLGVHDW